MERLHDEVEGSQLEGLPAGILFVDRRDDDITPTSWSICRTRRKTSRRYPRACDVKQDQVRPVPS